MRPCLRKRKAVVLLTLDELDAREAEALRSHLQSCEGCRNYFGEISATTKKLAARAMTSDVEASDAFHGRVMSRLCARESETVWEIARMAGRRINWRLGLPVAAILIVFVSGLFYQGGLNVARKPIAPRPIQIVAAPAAGADVAPTLGNYEMAANESLQKFDAFLNQEATERLPAGPVYTESELRMADGAK